MSQFNINRPRRICFNEWMNLAKQLSGQTDVSKDDLVYTPSEEFRSRLVQPTPYKKDDLIHRMEQVVLAKDPMRLSAADKYASDECASGAYNPNDPTEV